MIIHRRRGRGGGSRRRPEPDKDPVVEAIKEAQAQEGYRDIFRKTVRIVAFEGR